MRKMIGAGEKTSPQGFLFPGNPTLTSRLKFHACRDLSTVPLPAKSREKLRVHIPSGSLDQHSPRRGNGSPTVWSLRPVEGSNVRSDRIARSSSSSGANRLILARNAGSTDIRLRYPVVHPKGIHVAALKETGLRGWACRTRTQKCRRKLSH